MVDNDRDQLGIVAITLDGAVARTRARYDRAAVVAQHQDAVVQQRATRANSLVTLLLAVVAGALAAGALAEDNTNQVAASVVLGGALLAGGLLAIEASHPYRRWHQLVVTLALAACGSALAVAFGDGLLAIAGGATAGASSGWQLRPSRPGAGRQSDIVTQRGPGRCFLTRSRSRSLPRGQCPMSPTCSTACLRPSIRRVSTT